jgi:peptidoglycan hydrolase-like protein with peptidoglycan-binding domain
MAADIQVAGVAPREVAKYCESIGILGIGLYESDKDGYFVHIDTRTNKYFWYGQAQQYRSTFGGAPLNKPTTSTTTTKPAVKPTVVDKIDTVKEVQAWLNKNYLSVIGAKLEEDGKYGALTKAALTKALQKTLGFRGNNIDGIYGNRTKRAVKSLKIGNSGEMVMILQAFLVCNGYTMAYVDGSYGNGTAKAVESYQKAKGLLVDGKAGKETFNALCG